MNNIPFELNKVYDFYDDGKISPSRHSLMKVVKFVNGLYSARMFGLDDDGKTIYSSILDMWLESIRSDIDRFGSIAYKIYDWGCEDFVVCHPIKENGKEDNEEVVFARMTYGGWYTIGDYVGGEWNGRLMIPKSEK